MNERKLDMLLRLVGEVDAFERDLRTPVVVRANGPRPVRRLRLAVAPLAVAAAIALLWMLRLPNAAETTIAPGGSVHPPVRVQLAYCPAEGARASMVQPVADESSVVMAVMRVWNRECGCLIWQLHEWDNGEVVGELAPGEPLDIPLPGDTTAPAEQVVMVAVAREPGRLPQHAEDTAELLDCLYRSYPNDASASDQDTALYASSLQSCLPEGVTVVPQTFGR